jgi:hypothetical protein
MSPLYLENILLFSSSTIASHKKKNTQPLLFWKILLHSFALDSQKVTPLFTAILQVFVDHITITLHARHVSALQLSSRPTRKPREV